MTHQVGQTIVFCRLSSGWPGEDLTDREKLAVCPTSDRSATDRPGPSPGSIQIPRHQECISSTQRSIARILAGAYRSPTTSLTGTAASNSATSSAVNRMSTAAFSSRSGAPCARDGWLPGTLPIGPDTSPCRPSQTEHLLGLGNTADGRTGELAPRQDQVERRHRQGRFRNSHQGQGTVELEQTEIGICKPPMPPAWTQACRFAELGECHSRRDSPVRGTPCVPRTRSLLQHTRSIRTFQPKHTVRKDDRIKCL